MGRAKGRANAFQVWPTLSSCGHASTTMLVTRFPLPFSQR